MIEANKYSLDEKLTKISVIEYKTLSNLNLMHHIEVNNYNCLIPND